jgi:hypothetical protein
VLSGQAPDKAAAHTGVMTYAPTSRPPWPRQRLARRLLRSRGAAKVVAVAAVCVVTLAFVAVHQMWRHQVRAIHERQLKTRALVLDQRLAAQTTPFMVLAGDSHAELLAWDRLCGLPVVNIGMSGASVDSFVALASRLNFSNRPAAILLFIGTNDLARSREPASISGKARFRAGFEALTASLGRVAERVIYVPLLPEQDAGARAELLDLSLTSTYRAAAVEACGRTGCSVMPMSGLQASFRADGVHLDLADRRMGGALHRQIETTMCGTVNRRPAPAGISPAPSLQEKKP